MVKIMLDIETLGTQPTSAIVSIGAVRFGRDQIYEKFYRRVDLKSSVQNGMVIDPDTIIWWLGQSEESRGEITNKDRITLNQALMDFSRWIEPLASEHGDVEIWGNGATFDNVIVSEAYRLCQMKKPWRFSGDRCYRTIKNLFPEILLERVGNHHNALDDAESQAVHLMKIAESGVFGKDF
jgi:DNA polymerase III epsilon subunit-like protein